MSDFLIFKAAFNGSATPAVGTYTAEGATAQFNKNTSISPDYYLYNTAQNSAVQWFVPTAETTDFEFVADILTRNWTNRVTYFIIADSTGTTRLRMWSVYTNWHFENSDNTTTGGHAEYIGTIDPTTSGGFGVFHQFRVRVRKLTESSSSVEVYVDGTLKLTKTARAALITCAKIGFVGGVNTLGPGTGAGIKNAYVYDLSGGEVIDRGVLSGAFNRFINWMKSVFALKSDIPTVNNGTLTIQQNGTDIGTFSANQATDETIDITVPDVNNGTLTIQQNGTTVDTFTANSSSDKTVNIQCVDLTNNQTVAGNKTFSGNTKFAASATIEKSGGDVELLIKNTAVDATSVSANTLDDIRFVDSSDRITGAMRISYDTSNGVTAMLYARSYSADGSVSSTNGISITSNQQTGAARANVSANLLPNSTGTYDLGSSAAQWNNAYIKALTINGVAAGDILTHNAAEFVPVSGGAVMAPANNIVFLGTTDYNSEFLLMSGGNWGSSPFITMYGSEYNSPDKGAIRIVARILSPSDTKDMFLYPSGTWTWEGTAVQLPSDQRYKQQIAEIDDKLLDAWEDVNLVQFKYNDAVETKGDKARLHTGYVVQQIQKACEEHGVDISQYGLFCHEEYPEETEEVEVEQKDGTKTKERKVIREANEHYSLRYTEALIVECKYLRRCIERLEARLAQLENPEESQEKGADK